MLPCRFCSAPLEHTFVDLGLTPLANSYVEPGALQREERFYPLHARVCGECLLVQLPELESAEAIFSDYAYFSSYSDSWLEHCQRYSEQMVEALALGSDHLVIEVASNDGYLLQYFREVGVPVLGIEPAANVAQAALDRQIPTEVAFFGAELAQELVARGQQADLLVGNNVFAHVPNLNDFVAGLKIVLKPQGVLTLEFPHLLKLIEETQFDTIYHEHFSYFSLGVARRVLEAHGLKVFDVEELTTHGGSLRLHAAHTEDSSHPTTDRVQALEKVEAEAGLTELSTLVDFASQVEEVKLQLLQFLIDARREEKTVVGYGAAAKGNTLLNYCGVGPELVEYVVDRSPHKQGRYLPGTRIPIHSPDHLRETRPDYVLILPWNLRNEIREQMTEVEGWGGRFVVAVPSTRLLDRSPTSTAEPVA